MFKPIQWYENIYLISKKWIVISNNKTQILTEDWIIEWLLVRKPYVDKNGYLRISLRNWKTSKTWWVHQLVMLTYVWPYPTVNHHINHKDWNTLNPSLDNLEYITDKENYKYKNPSKIMPNGINHHCYMKRWKLSRLSKRVWRFQNDLLIEEYESLGECARKTWYNISNIWSTIHWTRQKNCHGFQFRYL